jgi:hypothetical protein
VLGLVATLAAWVTAAGMLYPTMAAAASEPTPTAVPQSVPAVQSQQQLPAQVPLRSEPAVVIAVSPAAASARLQELLAAETQQLQQQRAALSAQQAVVTLTPQQLAVLQAQQDAQQQAAAAQQQAQQELSSALQQLAQALSHGTGNCTTVAGTAGQQASISCPVDTTPTTTSTGGQNTGTRTGSGNSTTGTGAGSGTSTTGGTGTGTSTTGGSGAGTSGGSGTPDSSGTAGTSNGTTTSSDGTGTGTGSDTTASDTGTPQNLDAAAAPATPVTGAPLTQSQLNAALAEAEADWRSVGADPSGVTASIGDLGGLTLGQTTGTSIVIDPTAADWGWDVDYPADPASQHMSLVTVVRHELGHALGLDHTATGLMAETLAAGEV